MKTITVHLVLFNGEVASIECPEKYTDELYADLEGAMKRDDWWETSCFDGCTMLYRELHISRIAMNKVIGML